MHRNLITHKIIGCCIKVHRKLGPGLLESAYEECLCYELEKVGLRYQRQIAVPLIYEEVVLDCGYRMDILVEDQVVVELKSVEDFTDVHEAQILTYLKLAEKKLGLLINFNVIRLKDGVRRFVM